MTKTSKGTITDAALTAERAALTVHLDAGAYPGSRAWQRAEKARLALAAFDAAHPAVLADAIASREAEIGGRYQD